MTLQSRLQISHWGAGAHVTCLTNTAGSRPQQPYMTSPQYVMIRGCNESFNITTYINSQGTGNNIPLLIVCILRRNIIMSNQQTVHSIGIYHGLPVYPSEFRGLTAIITGANGISGNYMLRVLAEAPERWTKIYCLSRRPPAIPDGLPAQAEHIALDFLKDPEEIAKVLRERNVKADYVFFYSYVQVKPKEGGGLWSDAEEMCKVNGTLAFCQSSQIFQYTSRLFIINLNTRNLSCALIRCMPLMHKQNCSDHD